MFSSDDLVGPLSLLREQAEIESEMSSLEIETTLAITLADVCEALFLADTEIHQILGDETYDAIYNDNDPWAKLRNQVRVVYAKSRNVTIY